LKNYSPEDEVKSSMSHAVAEIEREELDGLTIFLHAGLMVFGLLAWLTGEWAGDYKKLPHWGFFIHKHLGLGVAFFLLLRIVYGFIGPEVARFAHWVPYTKDRLKLVWEDLLTLARLRLPDRATHQGLAGLVETFGLAVFAWMATTGISLYYFLRPGQRAGGAILLIKELHEAGEFLIPVFLIIHVGAVLLHALAGDHRWRKMLFMK
jgi:cytochrome b